MRWRVTAALLAASFAGGMLVAPASAQEITGTIVGTVLDSTGASLPGATVSVKNLDTGVVRDFQTTETGRYTAPFLTVGAYELTVTLTGFQPYTAKGIAVHVNDRLEIDATLSVGQLTDV